MQRFINPKDALAQNSAASLETLKKSLESLQKNYSANSVGIDTINNSIRSDLINYLNNVNNCDINSVFKDTYKLLDSINWRQIYTGKYKNFNSEITDLQKNIDNLKNSSSDYIGIIETNKTGYFSEYCDGYENAIKYSDIEKIKLKDLNNIKKSNAKTNNAGKIISSLNWYIACKVSPDEATDLSLWDGNVTVLFSNAATGNGTCVYLQNSSGNA